MTGRFLLFALAVVVQFSVTADGMTGVSVPMPGNVSVVVVRGEWASRQKGAERVAILENASVLSSQLTQIGIQNELVNDSDLLGERLHGVKVAVLAYNPSMPPLAETALADFVARGGRLFVCYFPTRCVARLLGVKVLDFRPVPADGPAPIRGILRTGAGLDGQPEFASQHSTYYTAVPAVTGEGEVVAVWADGEHRSIGIPALVRTPTGIFMSHTWHPEVGEDKRALLRSIFSSLSPEVKAGFSAADAARVSKDEDVRKYVKSIPGKRGERRLAFCHSPRGLEGRSWDESVRFLKENGFTDLVVNLCWADCAYYQSEVLPVDASVVKEGDAYVQCLAACRKYGVKCHVWKVCYFTGWHISKERESKFASEGRLVKKFEEGKGDTWAPIFCQSHPANMEREIRAMEEISAKGADGIQFDYIRYVDKDTCFCNGCRERFEKACGVKVANWPYDVRNDKNLARKWIDWRCSNVTRVVKSVSEILRAKYPHVEIAIAARAYAREAYESDGQDWVGWAKNGWIDIVCPMNYMPDTTNFRQVCRNQQKALEGLQVKIYPTIGLSCWHDEGKDALQITNRIIPLRQDGFEGFGVYNFDDRAVRAFPILATGPTRNE